jgi:hypothetical protein
VTGVLLDLVRHLSLDSAQEVRSYIPELLESGQGDPCSTVLSGHYGKYPASFPMSRPPPLPPRPKTGHSIAVMQGVHATESSLRDSTSEALSPNADPVTLLEPEHGEAVISSECSSRSEMDVVQLEPSSDSVLVPA